MIKIKRIYEKPDITDGQRILVERLWPRGIKKENAKITRWIKEIAPSTELRRWYKHDVSKWEEFREKYIDELKIKKEEIKELKEMSSKNTVTFVYSAHDEKHNSAVVLKEYLERD